MPRKRGRPPKVITCFPVHFPHFTRFIDTDSSPRTLFAQEKKGDESGADEAAPKRKRGRPPKVKAPKPEAEGEDGEGDDAEPTPKKKRGRPAKKPSA